MGLKVTIKGKDNAEQVKEQHRKLGKRSKTKGNNFERDIAKRFKEVYEEDLVRTPQSGGFAKKSVKGNDFKGDIVTVSEDIDLALHIECKSCKQITAPKWIEQAESDCPTGKIPTVIFHQYGTSKDYVIQELPSFYSLLGYIKYNKCETVVSNCKEEWRLINGYKDYLVSNKGNVKSIKESKIKILKPSVGSSGYYNVVLCEQGITKTVRVHQLVAEHFLRKKSAKEVINHIDGNKLNNLVENLEYVSYSDNNLKAYEQGLKPKGEDFYSAKLTNKQVFDIRVALGFKRNSIKELEDIYSVSNATISRVNSLVDYRNPYNLFLQCKNAKTWSLPSWFKQAESDCPKGKSPVVIFHQHGTSKDYIALSLDDFFKLVTKDKVILKKVR